MKLLTKKKLTGFVAVFVLALAALFVPVVPANAQSDCSNMNLQSGIDCAKGANTPTELFGGDGAIFTTIINTLLFIVGLLSVIMLIWGGIRYATSAGNSSSVTAAKNTIMYAIIGLVVAILAYAIVNWVLGTFQTT